MNDLDKLLIDSVDERIKDGKIKDKIIVLLIICMLLESICFYGGFVWYESQFDTTYTTQTETNESNDIDVNSKGKDSNANYIEKQINEGE